MTTVKTFAVVRNANGILEAHDASVSVELYDGIGIHLVGLPDLYVRESLLRCVAALNASGFVIPGRKVIIRYDLGGQLHNPTLQAELLDLPLAVALMAERKFARFDLSVRYIGRLCPDGRVDDIDGNVVRACRLKWPPTFVSSLTYPNGGVRPDPGHTNLTHIMRDYALCNDGIEELTKVRTRGTVVDAKVNEVHGVPICHFRIRTNGTGGASNEGDGGSRTRQTVSPNDQGGGSNEGDGILSCTATNEAGGMSIFERMAPDVTVEIEGRFKQGGIIVHKIAIV